MHTLSLLSSSWFLIRTYWKLLPDVKCIWGLSRFEQGSHHTLDAVSCFLLYLDSVADPAAQAISMRDLW